MPERTGHSGRAAYRCSFNMGEHSPQRAAGAGFFSAGPASRATLSTVPLPVCMQKRAASRKSSSLQAGVVSRHRSEPWVQACTSHELGERCLSAHGTRLFEGQASTRFLPVWYR
jgi:hypothetical protein